jgi:Spy/CpxP family protein refolding chaperone
MKRILQGIVVAGLVAVLVAPAMAQQGKGQRKGQGQGKGQGFGGFGQGGMMGMGGGMMILANPGVQKELKLTDEQVGKITTMARDQQEEMRSRFQDLRDASPEQRREAMTKYQAEVQKKIAGVLSADQMKRYDQVRYQNMYLAAFEDENVVKALKLTEDQRSKVRDMQRTLQEELRGQFQPGGGGGGDFQAMMAKRTEMQKAAFGKAMDTLTSEQKTAWKELVGEPYEVKFEPRRID